jgi:hypothetical protein
MKIIAHTKYGVFESCHQEHTEEEFEKLQTFMSEIASGGSYIQLQTEDGFVYLGKEIIQDSVFIVQE